MKFFDVEKKIFSLIRRPIYIYSAIFTITSFLLSSLSIWLQLTRKIKNFDYDTFWFDNIFYNTIQGNGFFYVSPNHYDIVTYVYPTISHFHQHNQPILLFILPFYYIFPSVYTLFGIQSILLGAAAIPLYLIGKEILDECSSKIITISYLLYPVVMWNTLYIHFITYAPFFIFLMVYAYIKDRTKLFYTSFLFCLFLKENIPIFLFPLGIYLLYDSHKKKIFSQNVKYKYILPILILAPIYFIFSFKYVIPHFTGGEYMFIGRYSELGSSVPEIFHNLVTNPSMFVNQLISLRNLSYILQILLPVSFIPLLSFETFSISIPIFLQNFLSTTPEQTLFFTQYHFEITSAVFLSVIVSFAKMKRKENKLFEKFRIRYFYLVLFWAMIFALIRLFMFMHAIYLN
jgi:uncharacterized membrane protein